MATTSSSKKPGSKGSVYNRDPHLKSGGKRQPLKGGVDMTDPKRREQQKDYRYSDKMDKMADAHVRNEKAASGRGDAAGARAARAGRNAAIEKSMRPKKYRE